MNIAKRRLFEEVMGMPFNNHSYDQRLRPILSDIMKNRIDKKDEQYKHHNDKKQDQNLLEEREFFSDLFPWNPFAMTHLDHILDIRQREELLNTCRNPATRQRTHSRRRFPVAIIILQHSGRSATDRMGDLESSLNSVSVNRKNHLAFDNARTLSHHDVFSYGSEEKEEK